MSAGGGSGRRLLAAVQCQAGEIAWRVVVAPDSYKGSVSALGVAQAMERGILKVFPNAEVCKIPLADGGEGTVEALVAATRGQLQQAEVRGALGQRIVANWGILGDGITAVIEMAAASGRAGRRPRARHGCAGS